MGEARTTMGPLLLLGAPVAAASSALRSIVGLRQLGVSAPAAEPVQVVDNVSTCYRHRLVECRNLSDGREIHRRIAEVGLGDDKVVAGYLIHMYLKFADLEAARRIFARFNFGFDDAPLWTNTIGNHARFGETRTALKFFYLMLLEGVVPSRVTLVTVARLCVVLGEVVEGRRVFDRARLCGYDSDVELGNALLAFFEKWSSVEEARQVFIWMKVRDVNSWSTILKAYSRNGDIKAAVVLFHTMQLEGIQQCSVAVSVLLSCCTDSMEQVEGKTVHRIIQGSDLEQDAKVGAALVNMYSTFGDLDKAYKIFTQLEDKSLVSWNTMIAAYAEYGRFRKALLLTKQLQLEGVRPNKVTFVNSVKGCCSPSELRTGRLIHACCYEAGMEADIVLATALVNMYNKCGSLDEARNTFDRMKRRNAVSWSAIIAAYVQHYRYREAVHLFHLMELEGFASSNFTFASVLGAYAGLQDLVRGQALHRRISSSGMGMRLVMGTALLDMYAKCGALEDARKVFDEMQQLQQDVILWTTMISAYSQQGFYVQALELFQEMRLQPDEITFVAAVDACINLGSLALAEQVHGRVRECRMEKNAAVGTVLAYMYATFGRLEKAVELFDGLEQQPTVVTWNALIGAYSQRGRSMETMQQYRRMLQVGTRPDDITFCTLLESLTGRPRLVEGRWIQSQVSESGYGHSSGLAVCSLVSMYGRCGSLEEAEGLFFSNRVDRSHAVPWNSLMTVYAQLGQTQACLQLFQQMNHEGVIADDVTFISVVSACSHGGLLQEGCEQMLMMVEDHGIVPQQEHFGCLVDTLARAGWFSEAEFLAKQVPNQVSSWMALLSACAVHGDVKTGKRAAAEVLKLQPGHTGAYSTLTNLCSVDVVST